MLPCHRSVGIGTEAFYDYVLAHVPEFVRGRQGAGEAIAPGELGKPLMGSNARIHRATWSCSSNARFVQRWAWRARLGRPDAPGYGVVAG